MHKVQTYTTESAIQYCKCQYIKQTELDIIDLFKPPVYLEVEQTLRVMYKRLEKKFLIVFATADHDLEVGRSNCFKCQKPIYELKDIKPSSNFVAKQYLPNW
jgi:hypothetical protein